MNDVGYSTWSNYIIDIIKKYNVQNKDILEMACGTGQMAVNLAGRGYNVTAFDISVDMLAVASSKAADKGVDIRLLRQDMNDIKITQKFSIILCLCDSINYITSEKELFNLFKWVHAHMEIGGIFVFDINSSYKLRNIIGNNTFTYNEDDIAYIWDNYLTDEDTVEFYLTFFTREGTMYRRFDEVHVEKIYEVSDIFGMLKDAGFNNIEAKEAFTFDEPSETTERINFIIK
jgi:ubiquinone/menaquinone biosynthesis C-methylase UbiE